MKVLVALSCFAAVIATASALDCFVCNSATDGSCADDFEATSEALKGSFLKTCPDKDEDGALLPASYCKKVHMWLTGEYRVERDCGYRMREVDGPCYQTRADDHIVDTCQCKEDACNGASAAVPTLALGLVALGVMLH